MENAITYIDGQSNNEVALSQIVSLIELSEYCEQSFQYDCTLGKSRDLVILGCST